MSVTNTERFTTFVADLDRLCSLIKQHDSYARRIRNKEIVLFISLGYLERRATVYAVKHRRFERAWEIVKSKAVQYVKQNQTIPSFIKIDLVDQEHSCSIFEFIDIMTRTRKNYFRKGLAFDTSYKHAFLEQEINGNAFIQIDHSTNRGYLHEPNIQQYIKKNRPDLQPLDFGKVNQIILFTTVGFFSHNGSYFPLKNSELDNGRRDTELDRKELEQLIISGGEFLTRNVHSDGKFTYGYFSCYDAEISFYNMLRHASTLYAMCEVYECFPNDELLQAIKRGLYYLIVMGVVHVQKDDHTAAYIVDGADDQEREIKLGANAAAILALTKYTEVTGHLEYLPIAEQLARGILTLQNEDGSFHHVLHYPSLDIKEKFRIVYYDGEAAFALMRLFKLDRNELWLRSVERAFACFIDNKHWKHHDHWLSYCTNELTEIKPQREYFQFGLLNVRDKLDFIYNRVTTYPTFMELTLAGYKMIERLKRTEHKDLLQLEAFDESRLVQTIHRRAEHQRNGFFYPELAMYFKNPARIMGSYFIRHHSFRSRIDDVEHNLSGYCQYYKLFYQESASSLIENENSLTTGMPSYPSNPIKSV